MTQGADPAAAVLAPALEMSHGADAPAALQAQLREQERRSVRTIADLRLDLGRAREELRAMHRHSDALARRLDTALAMGSEIPHLRQRLEAEAALRNAMLQSTSWKITRPLRGLGGLLRHLRRSL